MFTFDGLFSEEIILHPLDLVIKRGDLVDHNWEILKDELTWCIRELSMEFSNVVTKGTADIDQKYRILALLQVINQLLLNREESRIHPRRPSLAVTAHVEVEHLAIGRVGVQVLKEGLLRLVSKLKRRVADVSRVLPCIQVSPFMELTKGIEAGSGTIEKYVSNLYTFTWTWCSYMHGYPAWINGKAIDLMKFVASYVS